MSGQEAIPNYTKKYVYTVTLTVEVDEGTYFPEWTDVKPQTVLSMEAVGMNPDEIADSVREIRTIRAITTPAMNIPGVDVSFMDIIPTHTTTEVLVECSVCNEEFLESNICWGLATPYCYECWDAPFTKEG